MYFFKNTIGNWIIGYAPDNMISKEPSRLLIHTSTNISVVTVGEGTVLIPPMEITDIKKNSDGDFYDTFENFKAAVSDFFVNAPSGGANNDPLDGVVINLEPGQYLSDVVQTITGATLENPVTINFYNHSKTVNWETFTEKIHWPQHVYLNFVGKMNCFSNSDFFTDEFSVSKMFLGFDFSRGGFALSGLPSNTTSIALSSNFEEETSIDLISELNDVIFDDLMYESQPFIHVRETHQIFYIKPNNEKIECTVSFENVNFADDQISKYMRYANCQSAHFDSANCQSAHFDYANCQSANFDSANCQSARFYFANCQSARFYFANCQSANFDSANCQSANFQSANLKNANWYEVTSIVGVNFRNADLTGGTNLPDRINTKAKWIAECGANNVNAKTIWVDGTSILS